MAYQEHISNISLASMNSVWLMDLIERTFKKGNETISPLRIMSKLGVAEVDQVAQITYQAHRKRLKVLLKSLWMEDKLIQKPHLHDTRGIKEVGYTRKSTNF